MPSYQVAEVQTTVLLGCLDELLWSTSLLASEVSTATQCYLSDIRRLIPIQMT